MTVDNDFNFTDTQRYARAIVEHCSSKRKIARILSLFAMAQYSIGEGASFIHDIVTLDFFLDIEGSMESFFGHIKPEELRERLTILLSASHHLNGRGEIVDSDEDSEGNLK